jgi:hypothetical protein
VRVLLSWAREGVMFDTIANVMEFWERHALDKPCGGGLVFGTASDMDETVTGLYRSFLDLLR